MCVRENSARERENSAAIDGGVRAVAALDGGRARSSPPAAQQV
jgi:hypothetical protein